MGKLTDDILKWTLEIDGNPARKELADVGNATNKLQRDNKALATEMAKLEAHGKKGTEEWKKYDAQIKANSATIKTNETRMAALRKELGVSAMTATELRKEMANLKRQMDRTDPNTKQWREMNAQLTAMNGRLGQIRGGMVSVNGVMGAFKQMLPAFGWAAFAGAAVAAFSKITNATDTLSTQWAVFMGGMREATNEFFRTLATGSWDNFFTNIRNAVEVGREYERMLDDIEAKQRAMSIAESDYKEEIVRIEEDLRNKGLTNEQRLAAGKRRIEIEEELARNRAKIAKEEYDSELMMAKQASKLNQEKLMQLVRDLDSEKKIKAEAFNDLQDELKKQEAKAAQGGAATGVFYPGMTSSSGNAAVISDIKNQMAGFSPEVVSYAADLRLLGNVTDEQLNKMVSAYGKFKEAEVSGRESIKRVITMVNNLQAEDKTPSSPKSQTNKTTLKTDFMDVANEVDQNIRIENMREQMDVEAQMEAERLADKKASEEEWTRFFEDQIKQRTDAEAKALQIEQEIADARVALKDLQVQAIGQLASSMASMFEQGSAAQIAMIAVEKAIAIAQIWMNLAKEKSAINLAAANIAAMPIPGARIAAAAYATTMTAKAIAAAGINTGLIVGQTVASAVSAGKRDKKDQYYSGGYTGSGGTYEAAGTVHRGEYVVPRYVLNLPQAAPAVQYLEQMRQNPAAGKSATTAANGIDAATANRLIAALEKFEQKKLVVYTELIKKDLDTLAEIEQKRGM